MNIRYIIAGLLLFALVGISFGSSLPANVYVQNVVANPAVTYPNLPLCTANFINGICFGSDIISGNQVLTGSLYVNGSITINPGSTLTTNGFIIATSGLFNSIGATVVSGINILSSVGIGGTVGDVSATAGGNLLNSYGGTGGGGGGATGIGGAGNRPSSPTVTTSNVAIWITNGIGNYLGGTSGGGGAGGNFNGGNGGYGAYPIIIEANSLYLGNANANGIQGANTGSGTSGSGGASAHGGNDIAAGGTAGTGSGAGSGGGGGGGGGLIILSYTSNYIAGTYNVLGGAGGTAGTGDAGGSGASGNVIIVTNSIISVPGSLSMNIIYPYEIYTTDNSNIYTLNSIIGTTSTLLQGPSNTITYVAPSNQPSGNYLYSMTEYNGISSTTVSISISVSMNDIASPLTFPGTCANVIQYLTNCAGVPGFTSGETPSTWYIATDNPNNFFGGANQIVGGNNIAPFSNRNLTFTPNVILTYNSFSPAIKFQANAINNPVLIKGITQNSIGFVAAYNTLLSNSLTRKLFNVNTYDQQFLSTLNAISTFAFNFTINNYTGYEVITIPTNIIGSLAENTVWIGNSLYSNPPLVISNIVATSSAASHVSTVNNYFSNTINYGTWPTYDVYLPNIANSTPYSFYIYGCAGYANPGGYIWTSSAGTTGGAPVTTQQYQYGTVPFTLYLQSSQSYAFSFWSALGSLILGQTQSVPSSPINVYLPCATTNVINTSPIINATCYGVVSTNSLVCSGGDTQDYVTSWNIIVTYYPSLLSTQTLFSNVINGSSFSQATYQLPNHTTDFYVSVSATLGRNVDPIIWVIQNQPIWTTKGITPNVPYTYSALYLIIIFFGFIAVAYVNEVAAMIGFPLLLILLNQIGIVQIPGIFAYGLVGIMVVIAILLLTFRE